jgi:TolB-like protein/Flp pilus assembly protein TadD
MSLVPGTKLGPYEVLGALGAGGMGEVYRARDPRLERDVAIKVLPGEMAADPQALARFEREAKAVAALSHPNILAIHDFGREGGVAYAVMELLEGETLRSRIARSALPVAKVIEIGAAIADGLSAAHSKGIIHRDLKPANLFLTADGRVKILDFGLAQTMRAAGMGHEDSTMTAQGIVMGTVGYMSPEQVRGDAVDSRTDIFALGCVLYEMAAAKRAFQRETAPQTMAAILEAEPPALGQPLPEELGRVIRHCLEKQPQQRFQSAHDVAFALRAGTARRAAPPLPVRWVAVAAAVLVAAGAVYWLVSRPRGIDSLAVLPFDNASHDPNTDYLSAGITETLTDSLAQLPGLRVMSHNSAARMKNADAGRAGKELGVRSVLMGSVRQQGDAVAIAVELVDTRDGSHIWGEHFNRKSADLQAVEEEISREIAGRLQMKLAGADQQRLAKRQTGNPEAYQLYLRGLYDAHKATFDGLHRAEEYFRQALALDPNYALVYSGMAEMYFVAYDWQISPAESYPKGIAAARKALELDPTLASPHATIGFFQAVCDRDWAAAEREARRAVELDSRNAWAHATLGFVLTFQGRFDEAIAESHKATELDPLDSVNGTSYGLVQYLSHHFDTAEEDLRKVAEMEPGFFWVHVWRGAALIRLGRAKEALAEHEKARQDDDNSESAPALAYGYAAVGEREKAEALIDDLARQSRQGRYIEVYWLAAACARLGDKDRAFQFLEQTAEQRGYLFNMIRFDPAMDPLRSDPRFDGLVRRLPPAK